MTSLFKKLSFLSSNSLFSTIITLYTLILLYVPSLFLQIIFSPILISTIILLLHLLRLGATQMKPDSPESNSIQFEQELIKRDQNAVSAPDPDPDPKSNPCYAESFVEWDVRAPLEVIYEEYEGQEAEENDVVFEENRETQMNIIQRYASLSMFYPESDSDTSSDGEFQMTGGWDSPENMCFRWEDENDREGLIEIALDYQKRSTNNEVDEDNLIEIDL